MVVNRILGGSRQLQQFNQLALRAWSQHHQPARTKCFAKTISSMLLYYSFKSASEFKVKSGTKHNKNRQDEGLAGSAGFPVLAKSSFVP